MKQRTKLLITGSALMLSGLSFALAPQVFQIGPPVEYVIAPHEALSLSNPFLWTIKSVCTITSPSNNSPLTIKAVKKSGSVNGTNLSAGNSLNLLVNYHDKLDITAQSGAQVELTNHDEATLVAECTVV